MYWYRYLRIYQSLKYKRSKVYFYFCQKVGDMNTYFVDNMKLESVNPPMPDSKIAQRWYFFLILEISNFLGFQNVFPKLHEPSWFLFFFVFSWIFCFFVPHYTRQILQKNDTKRNDHVFPKLNESSCFLQIFVLVNSIFHIFYFLFPNWYIH